jgi:hypothetical protein
MKKISAIIILLFGATIMSCIMGGKCDPVEKYFKIIALTAGPYAYSDSTKRDLTALIEGQEVFWDDFVMGISFEPEFFSARKSPVIKGEMLYALDCAQQGEGGTRIGLQRVDIVTLNDYNDTYRANDTITEMINAAGVWTYGAISFSTLESLLFELRENIDLGVLKFKPIEAPSEGLSPARFRIIFELKNGEIFEQETVAVVLRK